MAVFLNALKVKKPLPIKWGGFICENVYFVLSNFHSKMSILDDPLH